MEAPSTRTALDISPQPIYARPPTRSVLSHRVEKSISMLSGITPKQRQRGKSQISINSFDSYHESLLQTEGQETVGSATFQQSCFNSINLLLGVGVLSLPYAIKVSGWIIGMSILLMFSLITNYTGKLIGQMMNRNVRSFPDIGLAAFGRLGQGMISLVFVIELFSGSALYLIVCSDNLHALLEYSGLNLSRRYLLLLVSAVVYPTSLTSKLSILSYASFLGVLSSCFLVLSVVTIGAINAPTGNSTFIHPAETRLWTDSDSAPLCIGLIMVGFAGHACFPSILNSMSKPELYPRVLDISFAVCMTFYFLIAATGYLMYGEATEAEITLNIVKDGAHGIGSVNLISRIATILIVINPLTKFSLVLNPVCLMAEEAVMPCFCRNLSHGSGQDNHKTSEKELEQFEYAISAEIEHEDGELNATGKEKVTWCQFAGSIMIRTTIFALCVYSAIAVPNFAHVVGFIGSFCSCVVSLVFPLAAALVLLRHTMSPWQTIITVLLFILSCILSIWGTVTIFTS